MKVSLFVLSICFLLLKRVTGFYLQCDNFHGENVHLLGVNNMDVVLLLGVNVVTIKANESVFWGVK